MEHCDAILDCRFRSHTLDGLDHNTLGLFVSINFRLIHDLIDVALGMCLRLCLQAFDQMVASLFGRNTGKLFKLRNLALVHTSQFLFFVSEKLFLRFETSLLRVEFLFASVHLLVTLVDHHLALFEFILRL